MIKGTNMSRVCDISGKRLITGHNVSNSNIKLKRIFAPNLQKVTLKSDALGKVFKLKISTKMLRTISKYGNLDSYLLSARATHLSSFALNLKRKIRKVS